MADHLVIDIGNDHWNIRNIRLLIDKIDQLIVNRCSVIVSE